MKRIVTNVDRLQDRFEVLCPTPRISKSLKILVAEGNKNPDEIITHIRLDPLLATRILREANRLPSAKRNGYASIEQATTAIGFERMYDILSIYACQHRDENEITIKYFPNFWKRAITSAIFMEILAGKHRLDPYEAYSIGLLHSLVNAINEAYEVGPKEPPSKLLNQQNHRLMIFGSSGTSYSLFRSWRFPDRFTDPVRCQYSPLDCITNVKMACLLNLSKWVTGVIRATDELPNQAKGPDPLVLNLLGEGEQTLWDLVSDVSDSLQHAEATIKLV